MAAVTLRSMTGDEYTRWLTTSLAGYAESWVKNGTMTADEAATKERTDFEPLLPDARDTPEQHLWTAVDPETGSPGGVLWINVTSRGEGRRAFVYDIEIDE